MIDHSSAHLIAHVASAWIAQHRRALLVTVCMCLAWPLTIADFGGGAAFSAGDLVAVAGLVLMLICSPCRLVMLLVAALVLTLCSVLMVAILHHPSTRAFASWAYFAKPHASFVVGLACGASAFALRDFLRIWSYCFLVFCVACVVIAGVAWDVTRMRTGLNLLGIDVFGSAGANAFSMFLGVGVMLSCTAVVSSRTRSQIVAGLLASAIATGMIVASLSRSALAGVCLFFCMIALRFAARLNSAMLLKTMVGLLAVVSLVVLALAASDHWLYKTSSFVAAIRANDVDALLTGRVSIWREMISDLGKSPWFGTGFQGWHLRATELPLHGWIDVGVSAHNQWLGIAWKAGWLQGLTYVGALTVMAVSAVRSVADDRLRVLLSSTLCVAMFVYAMVQDALIYPNTAHVLFFLMGLMAAERGPHGAA